MASERMDCLMAGEMLNAGRLESWRKTGEKQVLDVGSVRHSLNILMQK